MEAEIILSYRNEREAEAVANAVSPDNFKVPRGLFIKTTHKGVKVFTTVKCDLRVQTFMATIDDLLSCVSVAEKTFTAVKNLESSKQVA
jgi:hypothetical protein